MSNELKIFSGRSSNYLGEKIAGELNNSLGSCDFRTFSDGEIWLKYNENIRGCDVFLIQSTNPPADNILELLIMIDAAKRASAYSISAVIPYFGYARQDRKDQPRVSITSKLLADLITTAGADRIITMDLHSPQIQGFFNIPVDHLYGSAVFLQAFKDMKVPNLAVASPDAGAIKIARAYAKRLNADLILIDKRRPKPNVAEVMNIIGDVKGKNIIMIDDMIDTGGTFVSAINALKENGAENIYGACTHAVLSGEAIEKIVNSPIEKLFISDTLQQKESSSKIEVMSVSKVFAEAIYRTNQNQSISSLFDNIAEKYE
jgi:ribose-phosphate pyrophosphokinase